METKHTPYSLVKVSALAESGTYHGWEIFARTQIKGDLRPVGFVRDEVDAGRILRACNSHAKLLHALKMIGGITGDMDLTEARRLARVAIAKAEKE